MKFIAFPEHEKMWHRPNYLRALVCPPLRPTPMVGPFVVDDIRFHCFPSDQPAAP